MKYSSTQHITHLFAIIFLLLTCASKVSAWDDIYLLNSKYGWTQNSSSLSFNNASGHGECCTYLQSESSFAISINGQQYGPATNGSGLDAGDTGFNFGTTGHNAAKYIGSDGIVIIHSDQTGSTNSNTNPWIWITRPTIQFKYPWDGNNWDYQNTTDNEDGTYSYAGTYQGTSNNSNKGFNWAINNSEKGYFQDSYLEIETDLNNGDDAVFIFDSKLGKGYIYKLNRTITFNPMGGTPAPATQYVNYGSSITTLPTVTKADSTFVGWFTAPEGGTQITTADIIKSDLTLYAHWNKVEITNIAVSRNKRENETIQVTPTVTGLVAQNTYQYCWQITNSNQVDVTPTITQTGNVFTFTMTTADTYTLQLSIREGNDCSAPLMATNDTTFTVLGSELVINMRCDPANNWTHNTCIYCFKDGSDPNAPWPGDTMTYIGVDEDNYPWFTYTIPIATNYSHFIFNNNGTGLNQTGDISVPNTNQSCYEVQATITSSNQRNCTTITCVDETPRIAFLSQTTNQYQGVSYVISGKALFLSGEKIRYTYAAKRKSDGAIFPVDDNHSFIPAREGTDQDYTITITATNENGTSVTNNFDVTFITNPITLAVTAGERAIDKVITLQVTAADEALLSGRYYTFSVMEPGNTSLSTFQKLIFTRSTTYTTLSTGTYTFQATIYDGNSDGASVIGKAEVNWTISPKSYYIKHPFNSSSTDWLWKEMTYNGDGTYSYYEQNVSIFHSTCDGANIYTSTESGNGINSPGYIPMANIHNPNNIPNNTVAQFVYSVANNQLAVYPVSTTLYRIKSECENGTYYSNTISANDSLSFFAETAGSLTWQRLDNEHSGWYDAATITTKVPTNGVYVAYFAQLGDKECTTLKLYTREFTLYSEVSHYGTTAPGKDGARDTTAIFTQFIPNRNFENEYFNHYWVEYIDAGHNVMATVGNAINHNIARVLPYYILKEGANVRFSYDNTTNLFQRTFLAGSGSAEFLSIYGDDIFNSTGTSESSVDHPLPFQDGSDWVYSVQIRAKKGVIEEPISAKLIAKYQGTDRWILAEDGSEFGVGASKVVLGKISKDRTYNMNLFYDYKTNRLTAGWTPLGETIDSKQYVDADMLIVRNSTTTDVSDINYVSMTNDGEVLDVNSIITLFNFDRTNFYDGAKEWINANNHYHWISLPYNCAIQDIYGIEDYGTKWYMEEYRGDIRAVTGWLYEIPSFWSQMYLTDTLRANQGYVIYFNPEFDDFKEIGTGTEKISRLTLYFPSEKGEYTISAPSSSAPFIQLIPEHICTIAKPIDRRAIDSNWNVIGIPGYSTATITTADGTSSSVDQEHQTVTSAAGLRYYYTWNEVNSYSVRDISYKDEASSTRFQPTFAYMVQYAGDITWSTQAHLTNHSLTAPRHHLTTQKYCLQLLDSTSQLRDQAFVVLDSLSNDDYQLGYDLQKILSPSVPQIYTVAGDNCLAANQTSDTTSSIRLHLSLPEAHTYSIHLRESGQNLSPILYDEQEHIYTNLAQTNYTFSGTIGHDDTRFTLFFGQTPQQGTDLSAAQPTNTLHACLADGQIVLSSAQPINGCIRLFDAAGRLLSSFTNTNAIPAPAQSGIYLIWADNQTTRIFIP